MDAGTPDLPIDCRDTTRRILHAARELLEEGGPPALTIRKLARRAAVSPGSIYRRFADKDGILDLLFAGEYEYTVERLELREAWARQVPLAEVLRDRVEQNLRMIHRLRELDPSHLGRRGLAPADNPRLVRAGRRAMLLTRDLLDAHLDELAVPPSVAAFVVERGLPALLAAASRGAPELLRRPPFQCALEELVQGMVRPGALGPPASLRSPGPGGAPR